MTPFNERETRELLAIDERATYDFVDNFFKVEPDIRSAAEVAADYEKKVDDQRSKIEFTPTSSRIFYSILYSLFIIISVLFLISPMSIWARLGASIIPLVFVIELIELLGSRKSFKVIVSRSGLELGKIVYRWPQVKEVYIIRRSVSRRPRTMLVVALDTGVTEKYDVDNTIALADNTGKLCAYIEHFRNDYERASATFNDSIQ